MDSGDGCTRYHPDPPRGGAAAAGEREGGRQQRIADALGKNSAIILPTALDGGQRPFGLFGIDRAFWRGRSALKRDALATSLLERLLPDWSVPLGAVYWLTPPAGPRPKRVEVLGDFLVEKLARPTSMLRPVSKAKRR